MTTHEYTCRTCNRTVDPDMEPSAGEPQRCPDCQWQMECEEAEVFR